MVLPHVKKSQLYNFSHGEIHSVAAQNNKTSFFFQKVESKLNGLL